MEIITISFNIKETLKQTYYKVKEDTFLVQNRSQTKSSGINLLAVHSTTKTLVPHEYQKDSHQVSVGLGLYKAEQE